MAYICIWFVFFYTIRYDYKPVVTEPNLPSRLIDVNYRNAFVVVVYEPRLLFTIKVGLVPTFCKNALNLSDWNMIATERLSLQKNCWLILKPLMWKIFKESMSQPQRWTRKILLTDFEPWGEMFKGKVKRTELSRVQRPWILITQTRSDI